MSAPMFSIITPVYNREKHIGIAIESVLHQSFSNWELIIIDDGSTDGTYALCQKYAEADSRIRCFRTENSGVSVARNQGLDRAHGKYVLFLDSDDTFHENALSVLYSNISVHTDTDMICFGTDSVADWWAAQCCEGKKRLCPKEIREQYLPTHINIYPQDTSFLLNFIWNKCYRYGFLKDHGFRFDEKRRTWEDGLFVVNCIDQAQNVLVIPESLHCGCEDPSVHHLSAELHETQLPFYIQDETEYKRRFENEFDFRSEHYCHSNFRVISMLFSRVIEAYGEGAKDMIDGVLNRPIVAFWADHMSASDENEKRIQEAIQHKDVNRLYRLYRPSLLRRFARKLLRVIRTQKTAKK